MTASAVLSSVEDILFTLQSRPVHPIYFPYALGATLHAARISIAYRRNAGLGLSFRIYLAGYLVMAWGGMLITHALLGLPPPAIYSVHLYINYLTVHIFLTLLVPLSSSPSTWRLLDTTLLPLDALLRANSIAGALALARTVPPPRGGSLLLRLFIGAAASAGGGTLAATLGTWRSDWSVSTPVFLRPTAGLHDTLDVWGGALAAALHDALTGAHPAWRAQPLLATVLPADTFSHGEATAAITLLLGTLFAWRVYGTHWEGKQPVADRRSEVVATEGNATTEKRSARGREEEQEDVFTEESPAPRLAL